MQSTFFRTTGNRSNPITANRNVVRDLTPEEALAITAETQQGQYLPILLLLDGSSSMNEAFAGMKSRWDVLLESVGSFVAMLQRDETLSLSARLSVIVFNSDVQILLRDVLAADLDRDSLMRRLQGLRPGGCTLMGHAVCDSLHLWDEKKEELRRNGASYYQPMLVLFTDGQATNANGVVSEQTLSQAYHECDTRIAASKLTVLPFGIAEQNADPKEFQYLNRLARRQNSGGTPAVLSTVQDVRKAFRFLGQTAVAITKGEQVDFNQKIEDILNANRVSGI